MAIAPSVALTASPLPAASEPDSSQVTLTPQQQGSAESNSLPCTIAVHDPHWSNTAETIRAKVTLSCWNVGSNLVRIGGYFGYAAGGPCGNPAYGPYSPLWQGNQCVTTKFGSPGVVTVYLPARSTNPHYGASGTYYGSASAYIDSAAIAKSPNSDDAAVDQESSSRIDSDSTAAYVGGQCQG